MISKKYFWGKYELKNGDAWQFTGGQALVFIKRLTYGWMISDEKNDEIRDQLAFKVCDSFTANGKEIVHQTGRSDILHVLPSLPIKPVVLRNNKTIIVSPKQSIKLYLAIPINIQFYFSQIDEDHLMTEIALENLSDTWFGDSDIGEPAYSIGQQYALLPEELELKNYEAICPVKITNNSNHPLELERLIIRVENLLIYLKNERLMTSQVTIDFKGPDQISNIHFSTDKKIHGEHPVIVAKQRSTGTKTILGKSFHFIKHFTQ